MFILRGDGVAGSCIRRGGGVGKSGVTGKEKVGHSESWRVALSVGLLLGRAPGNLTGHENEFADFAWEYFLRNSNQLVI